VKEFFMKKRNGVLLVLLVFSAVAVFATTAKRGETWVIEYKIVWDDTYETLSSDTITHTFGQSQSDIERWAKRHLGWGPDTRKVDGRTQRIIIESVTKIGDD
jgi:hypothetical protein